MSTSFHLSLGSSTSEDLKTALGSKSVKLCFSCDDTTVQEVLLEDAYKTSSRHFYLLKYKLHHHCLHRFHYLQLEKTNHQRGFFSMSCGFYYITSFQACIRCHSPLTKTSSLKAIEYVRSSRLIILWKSSYQSLHRMKEIRFLFLWTIRKIHWKFCVDRDIDSIKRRIKQFLPGIRIRFHKGVTI